MFHLFGVIKKMKVAQKYGFDTKKVNLSKDLRLSVKKISFKGFAHFEGGQIVGQGRVEVGDNVIVGPGLLMMTEVHDYNTGMLPYDGNANIIGDITIGENVWIGSDVTIMPGVIIGEGAVIGAKSFINENVPALSIAVGTPAKVIKNRDASEYQSLVNEKKLYLHKKYL